PGRRVAGGVAVGAATRRAVVADDGGGGRVAVVAIGEAAAVRRLKMPRARLGYSHLRVAFALGRRRVDRVAERRTGAEELGEPGFVDDTCVDRGLGPHGRVAGERVPGAGIHRPELPEERAGAELGDRLAVAQDDDRALEDDEEVGAHLALADDRAPRGI